MRAIMYILPALVLVACTTGTDTNDVPDLRPYYFPVEEFEKPVIYIYQANDGSRMDWEMHYNDAEMIFTTEITGPYKTELTKELITDEGAFFSDFSVTWNGEDIEGEIINNEVCKWKMDNFSDVNWTTVHVYGEASERVSKTRRIKAADKKCEFKEKTYDAVIFEDNYEVSFQTEKKKDVYQFKQITTYAKGIGIVKYIREYRNRKPLEVVLVEIKKK